MQESNYSVKENILYYVFTFSTLKQTDLFGFCKFQEALEDRRERFQTRKSCVKGSKGIIFEIFSKQNNHHSSSLNFFFPGKGFSPSTGKLVSKCE